MTSMSSAHAESRADVSHTSNSGITRGSVDSTITHAQRVMLQDAGFSDARIQQFIKAGSPQDTVDNEPPRKRQRTSTPASDHRNAAGERSSVADTLVSSDRVLQSKIQAFNIRAKSLRDQGLAVPPELLKARQLAEDQLAAQTILTGSDTEVHV